MALREILQANNYDLYCDTLYANHVDVPVANKDFAYYSSSAAITYGGTGATGPANLLFATTEQQNGITKSGSDTFIIGATGTYEIDYSGYINNSALSIQQVKLETTINGATGDNQVYRQPSGVFKGAVLLKSVANLNASDQVKLNIVADDLNSSLTMTSLAAGQKNSKLIIKKL